jgi:hypothetical protein
MRIFLWIGFLFAALPLGAYTDTLPSKPFYLTLGAGTSYQALRDQAMSPLLYDGFQLASYAGFDQYLPGGLHRLDMFFWFGGGSAASGRTTENYSFAANGGYLFNLKTRSPAWQARLGGQLTTWGSFRYHTSLTNSNTFYEFFIGLGPAATLGRDFRFLKRKWHIGGQLNVPLLVAGARPSYIGLEKAPFDDEDVFPDLKYMRLGSLDIVQNVKTRFELVMPLKRGNRISLLYYWDIYRSGLSPQPVTQSMQSLQFLLHVRL